MGANQGESRQAVCGHYRLGGDTILIPRLAELLHDLRTAVVQATNSDGVRGWRLRRDPPGVTSLFFATGCEQPDRQLIDAAIRTVEVLALDQDSFSVTIEVRRSLGQREPELDIVIAR